METIIINDKEYQLDIDKAKEQGLLKEKDTKPRSWEEYDKKFAGVPHYRGVVCDINREFDAFGTHEESLAFGMLGRLIQLRDAWWGDWRPDWNDDEDKYCIYSFNGGMRISNTYHSPFILAFPTEEMATDFLNTFRDMIEQAKMFL